MYPLTLRLAGLLPISRLGSPLQYPLARMGSYPTDSAPESLKDEPHMYLTDSSLQGEPPICPPDSAQVPLQDKTNVPEGN